MPAIAAEFGIPLTIDDFARRRGPHAAHRRHAPRRALSRRRHVRRRRRGAWSCASCSRAAMLHGDERTVDGRTIAKIAADTVETPGPAGGQADRDADQAVRRPHDPQGLAGPGRLRRQAGRPRAPPPPRPGARVRLRGRVLRGRPRAPDQRGRRRRHPLRGPDRRPGHAGDAERHRRARRRGPGRERGAAHGRPVLRRDPRADDRPRGPGGGGRRADRAGRGGRHDHRGRRREGAQPRGGGRRAGRAARPLDPAAAELHDRRHGEVRGAGLVRVRGRDHERGALRRALAARAGDVG